MEDAKLQALHDTLSQIRGKKGLGTNTQYSWQRGGETPSSRHPAAAHLPDNVLYAHFLPEGVYDPNPTTRSADDGDGRIVKRDFSDAIMDDDDRTTKNKKAKKGDKAEKREQKELRKAEKKTAKKAEKLKAKIEEKKRQKKLERKLTKQQQSSGLSDLTSPSAIVTTDEVEVATNKKDRSTKNKLREISVEASDRPAKSTCNKKQKLNIDNVNKNDPTGSEKRKVPKRERN